MQLYLAGGAVRDILLGEPFSDRDYLVVGATRQDFLKAHPNAQEVGRTFPIFLLEGIEFSFPRAESLTEELESRDLTVNAMLLDTEGELICHPDSLDDLKNRILRPASESSFIIDPLRVFRAARFWATFPSFIPHHTLIESMREASHAGLLDSLPADRVGQEVVKALGSRAPGNFLRLLSEGSCLSPWFSEFEEAKNIPAGPPPYHDTNVLEHSCRTMDALAGSPLAVWMAMCHDLGKTKTPSGLHPKHHGHDALGETMAESLAKRIRLSNSHVTAGAKAARWHMVAGRYDELRAGTKVDLLMDLYLSRQLEPLFQLVMADQDNDYRTAAKRDLRSILTVSLPPEYMNQGPDSGKRLHSLRAQTLTKRSKK